MVEVTWRWILKLYCTTSLRFGNGSTKDQRAAAPEFDTRAGFVVSAASCVGKCPWPAVPTNFKSISAPLGAVCKELSANMYERGRTSKRPMPPRTEVFPEWKGSQAKPIRGSKFLSVGL